MHRPVFKPATRQGTVALLDQALVSGVNFVTGVLVGRLVGAAELGIYALGFTIVNLVVVAQDALISVPYTVFGNRLDGAARAKYAGASLAHAGLLSATAVALLAVAALLLGRDIGPVAFAPAAWVLVATVPFAQLREMGRRLSFAHLRVATVLKIDVTAAAVQLGALGLLIHRGSLSATTGLMAMGLAAAVGGVGWLISARATFRVVWTSVRAELGRHLRFGRWDLSAQCANWVNGYGLYWLLALVVDAHATGVFAACTAVVALSNPFVLGIGNVVGPKTAQSCATGDRRGLTSIVSRTTLVLGLFMALFCASVLAIGGWVLVTLYGPEFAGYGATAVTLGLAQMAWALGLAPAHGLRALERPDVPFKASAASLCVTFVLALLLVAPLRVVGVAIGLCVGRLVELAIRGTAFYRLTRPAPTLGRDGSAGVLRDPAWVVAKDA